MFASLWRAGLLAGALALTALPAAGQAGEKLDIPAARSLSFQLIASGDYARAAALAQVLIERDPADQAAWLALAQARRAMGQNRAAVTAARRAWTLSESPANRYAAAVVAAQVLASSGARIRAQFWLRRAAEVAPNDALRDRAIGDFRYLRGVTPLSARLSFSLSPTSNINNGAKSERVAGGQISGAALALSGLEAAAGLSLSYRLPPGAQRSARLGLSLQTRSYALSAAARARAPASRNSDFAFQELELSHDISFAAPGGQGATDLGLRLGFNRYGGSPLSQFAGLTLQRRQILGSGAQVSFGAGAERINRSDAQARSSTVTRVFAGWSRGFDNGARLSLSAMAINSAAASFLTDNRALSLGAALQLAGSPLGGPLALSLSYVARDYRQPVPLFGVRSDRTIALGADLTLRRLSYYGFAPTLGIRASKTASSVDLYDSETIGLRLGVRSVF